MIDSFGDESKSNSNKIDDGKMLLAEDTESCEKKSVDEKEGGEDDSNDRDRILPENDDDEELYDEDLRNKSTLEQVIPMDRIRTGANNALSFWKWGVAKAKEKIDENEKVQEISKQTQEKWNEVLENVKPGLAKAQENISNGFASVKEKIDIAKPEIEKTFVQAYHEVEKGVEMATNSCKPHIDKAASLFNPKGDQETDGKSPFDYDNETNEKDN